MVTTVAANIAISSFVSFIRISILSVNLEFVSCNNSSQYWDSTISSSTILTLLRKSIFYFA